MKEDIPSWDISLIFYYYSSVVADFYNIFLLFSRKIGRMWYNGNIEMPVGLTDTLEYDARLVLMTRRAFIYYYISKGEFYGEQDASI